VHGVVCRTSSRTQNGRKGHLAKAMKRSGTEMCAHVCEGTVSPSAGSPEGKSQIKREIQKQPTEKRIF